MIDAIKQLIKVSTDGKTIDEQVELLNGLKLFMHDISPMKTEPVDCVIWVKNNTVVANDYNPNSVAPPEMELLHTSIAHDGYTQPIVAFNDAENHYTVVDGFHRHRVGKDCPDIQSRIHGYLPVSIIRDDCEDRSDRIAATIRHNRARGKHKIDAMSDIVIELKRRFWNDERIAKELGMEPDEVLRLSQIHGLSVLFKDEEFSKSWEMGELDAEEQIEEIIE